MVKKRKWSAAQRHNFSVTMKYNKLEKERERAALIQRNIAEASKAAIRDKANLLKQEVELRKVGGGIDVSTWRSTQRPSHIYIQEAGRLRRYDLRSLEVYVPENIVL